MAQVDPSEMGSQKFCDECVVINTILLSILGDNIDSILFIATYNN